MRLARRPLTSLHWCNRGEEEIFILFLRRLPSQLGCEGGDEGEALAADVIPHCRVACMRERNRKEGRGRTDGGREGGREGGRRWRGRRQALPRENW